MTVRNGVPSLPFLCLKTQWGCDNASGMHTNYRRAGGVHMLCPALWVWRRRAVPRVYDALRYNALARYNEQVEGVRCAHIVPRVVTLPGTSAKWIGVRCVHAVPRVMSVA